MLVKGGTDLPIGLPTELAQHPATTQAIPESGAQIMSETADLKQSLIDVLTPRDIRSCCIWRPALPTRRSGAI
jgi:hypothetical protein